MAIELIDKIKPKNGGNFPMVDAEDVLMPNGQRLSSYKISSGAHTKAVAEPQELTFNFASTIATSDYIAMLEPLVIGEYYKVVWGDKDFVCQCFDKVEGGGLAINGFILGNASVLVSSVPNTGEPFAVMSSDGVSYSAIKRPDDPTATIAIYGEEDNVYGKAYVQTEEPVGAAVGTFWFNPDEESAGGGASVELDTTLSESGKAADAGAVGRVLTEAMQTVNGELANKQPKGNYVQKVNGQTPDANGNVTVSVPSVDGFVTMAEVKTYVDGVVEQVGADVEEFVQQYVAAELGKLTDVSEVGM